MILRKTGIFSLLIFLVLSLNAQIKQNYEIQNKNIKLTEEAKDYYQKNLPAIVDNSQEIFFPTIYDQIHWVCNQVSASHYMMTYEMCRLKNLNAVNPQHQFSIYYPWNWSHGGHGWYGGAVSTTLNIAKTCGIPFIWQSPADLLKDSSIWISGYNEYYKFMQNRIKDYYFIDVSNEEGLLALKAWVYDHARNERPGGLASFMANIASGGAGLLPEGTPEAGAYVMTKCGTDPSHARTIVGYNDNICWDYNGDGQYTNHIDINGDGVVDIRDWEIGAFKVAESYGPNWQKDGFMYIMYKCVADQFPDGGILNNQMMVIEAIEDYKPLLTAKVKLNHVYRGNIKVSIGLSTNINASKPDIEIDFPIVNYQGGDKYMQGGTSENDKYIEFGFDITPLLSYVNPNNVNKFFVVGRERDSHNEYDGAITNFSIYLHSTEPEKTAHWNGNEEFNGSVIYVPLLMSIPFDKPEITTEDLPIFSHNSSFQYYMQADGGKQPYNWYLEAIID
ncbi:MAG: hypothetical protein GX879_02590, partial [Bacteroidales bacterium]|nr:hypothetical protein [Bacteroidales bacterium]